MEKAFIFFSLFLLVFYGCSEKEEMDSMTIEFGTACGWCAGQEFIEIQGNEVKYTRLIPCGENMGTTTKDKSISNQEWNEIKTSFDYDMFLTLQHDECNVCVDGCDEILTITLNGNEHRLSYSPSTEIEGMGYLLEKLDELMEEMRD